MAPDVRYEVELRLRGWANGFIRGGSGRDGAGGEEGKEKAQLVYNWGEILGQLVSAHGGPSSTLFMVAGFYDYGNDDCL